MKPGDLVGVNKDSYLILDTLPSEYDSRVKAMEVDEKPTEEYSDIGGLDKQVGVSFFQLEDHFQQLITYGYLHFLCLSDTTKCRCGVGSIYSDCELILIGQGWHSNAAASDQDGILG